MRSFIWSAALAVLLCSTFTGFVPNGIAASPPSLRLPEVEVPVPGPVVSKIEPGQIVPIAVDNLTPELARRCATSYYPRPEGAFFFPAQSWDGTMVIFFSAPTAGKYLVAIYAPPEKEGGPVGKAEIEVVVGGDNPVPPPPTPDPPAPVAQKIQAVVIEETGNSTPEFMLIRDSKKIRDWCEAGGHRLFCFDIDSARKAGGSWKSWADRTEGKPLPYVFIAPVSGGQTVLSEQAAPQTVDAFLAYLQKYGGVGSKAPAAPTTLAPTYQQYEQGAGPSLRPFSMEKR